MYNFCCCCFHKLWLIHWLSVSICCKYKYNWNANLCTARLEKCDEKKFVVLQKLSPFIINHEFNKFPNIPRGCKTYWIDEFSQVNSTETLKTIAVLFYYAVCLFVCLFWEYYLMLGLLMHSREMSDDEIPNVGREFDERHHWHSLKPLSDDYDRTKKSLTGKIPPSLLILKVNQQRTVFTVWNHSTSLNYIVNISLFRKTSKRSWAKETVFSS